MLFNKYMSIVNCSINAWSLTFTYYFMKVGLLACIIFPLIHRISVPWLLHCYVHWTLAVSFRCSMRVDRLHGLGTHMLFNESLSLYILWMFVPLSYHNVNALLSINVWRLTTVYCSICIVIWFVHAVQWIFVYWSFILWMFWKWGKYKATHSMFVIWLRLHSVW